jgi:hypothetical protein
MGGAGIVLTSLLAPVLRRGSRGRASSSHIRLEFWLTRTSRSDDDDDDDDTFCAPLAPFSHKTDFKALNGYDEQRLMEDVGGECGIKEVELEVQCPKFLG